MRRKKRETRDGDTERRSEVKRLVEIGKSRILLVLRAGEKERQGKDADLRGKNEKREMEIYR